MKDITILYHTSNREEESFEKKVMENILKAKGDLPIVSVSQKPIDFGNNICVGLRDCCEVNLIRQRLIGLNEIKTQFVILAESDVLYSPDYFSKAPTITGKLFVYPNTWVVYHFKNGADKKRKFWFKGKCEGAQIADRLSMIDYCNRTLEGITDWGKTGDKANMKQRRVLDVEPTWIGDPIITCKTGNGLRKSTQVKKIEPVDVLPYWGSASDVINKFCI